MAYSGGYTSVIGKRQRHQRKTTVGTARLRLDSSLLLPYRLGLRRQYCPMSVLSSGFRTDTDSAIHYCWGCSGSRVRCPYATNRDTGWWWRRVGVVEQREMVINSETWGQRTYIWSYMEQKVFKTAENDRIFLWSKSGPIEDTSTHRFLLITTMIPIMLSYKCRTVFWLLSKEDVAWRGA